MLFLVLQANYFKKISLILIFSLVNPNAPGLYGAGLSDVSIGISLTNVIISWPLTLSELHADEYQV